MSSSLLPQDKLSRRQLAKILAQMIKDDFEKARAHRIRAAEKQVAGNGALSAAGDSGPTISDMLV